VLEAAREVRYHPNSAARNLRRRRTDILGLYTRYGYLSGRSHFEADVLGGLQEGCDAHRKDLLLHGAFHGHSAEGILAELADGRVDGLVLLSDPGDPLVELLLASALPAVAVVDAIPGLPSVVADDALGMRRLVEHLAGLGHRRLFYRDSHPRPVSGQRRRAAYDVAVRDLGLETTEAVCLEHRVPILSEQAPWMEAPRDRRPTAAVCWNDVAGYDLLGHCRHRGLRVPEDLAITGFDGIAPPPGWSRRLTTTRAPWLHVARTAVDLLVRRIEGEPVPAETVLPVEFAPGDTT
jgi:DNA-binding LacI/PurR family transcriptional regulator